MKSYLTKSTFYKISFQFQKTMDLLLFNNWRKKFLFRWDIFPVYDQPIKAYVLETFGNSEMFFCGIAISSLDLMLAQDLISYFANERISVRLRIAGTLAIYEFALGDVSDMKTFVAFRSNGMLRSNNRSMAQLMGSDEHRFKLYPDVKGFSYVL